VLGGAGPVRTARWRFGRRAGAWSPGSGASCLGGNPSPSPAREVRVRAFSFEAACLGLKAPLGTGSLVFLAFFSLSHEPLVTLATAWCSGGAPGEGEPEARVVGGRTWHASSPRRREAHGGGGQKAGGGDGDGGPSGFSENNAARERRRRSAQPGTP
jgi:hypothetical protein